jgi:hypothetical protein
MASFHPDKHAQATRIERRPQDYTGQTRRRDNWGLKDHGSEVFKLMKQSGRAVSILFGFAKVPLSMNDLA